LAPASRKTAARSPATIHRVRFIINSFIEDYLHPIIYGAISIR
jgi:hypothetical protein